MAAVEGAAADVLVVLGLLPCEVTGRKLRDPGRLAVADCSVLGRVLQPALVVASVFAGLGTVACVLPVALETNGANAGVVDELAVASICTRAASQSIPPSSSKLSLQLALILSSTGKLRGLNGVPCVQEAVAKTLFTVDVGRPARVGGRGGCTACGGGSGAAVLGCALCGDATAGCLVQVGRGRLFATGEAVAGGALRGRALAYGFWIMVLL